MPCRAAAPDRGRAVPVRPRDMTASSSSPPPRARNDPPALPPVHVPVRPRATLPSAAGQVTRRERRPHQQMPAGGAPGGETRRAGVKVVVDLRACSRSAARQRTPSARNAAALPIQSSGGARARGPMVERPCRARAACARQSYGCGGSAGRPAGAEAHATAGRSLTCILCKTETVLDCSRNFARVDTCSITT